MVRDEWQLRCETGRLQDGQPYTRLFAYGPAETTEQAAWYGLCYHVGATASPQEFSNTLMSLAAAIKKEPLGYQERIANG